MWLCLQWLCLLCLLFGLSWLSCWQALQFTCHGGVSPQPCPSPPTPGFPILGSATLQVQIDPYLEDSPCHICGSQPGPFFCRDQVSPLGPGSAKPLPRVKLLDQVGGSKCWSAEVLQGISTKGAVATVPEGQAWAML